MYQIPPAPAPEAPKPKAPPVAKPASPKPAADPQKEPKAPNPEIKPVSQPSPTCIAFEPPPKCHTIWKSAATVAVMLLSLLALFLSAAYESIISLSLAVCIGAGFAAYTVSGKSSIKIIGVYLAFALALLLGILCTFEFFFLAIFEEDLFALGIPIVLLNACAIDFGCDKNMRGVVYILNCLSMGCLVLAGSLAREGRFADLTYVDVKAAGYAALLSVLIIIGRTIFRKNKQ